MSRSLYSPLKTLLRSTSGIIQVKPQSDGTSVALTASAYHAKIRNSNGYVLDILANVSSDSQYVEIPTDSINTLSPGRYGIELWSTESSGDVKYPDSGFLDLLITTQTLSISGQILVYFNDDQNTSDSFANVLTIKGDSAYDIAVRKGYVGTEDEWLNDIQGSNLYTADVGDGSTTSFVLTHNLGSMDVTVSVRRNFSPFDVVLSDILVNDGNNVTIKFDSAPLFKEFHVVIIGPKHSVKINSVVTGAGADDWHGKTGIFLGDSITEVNYRATEGYVAKIKRRTNLNTINQGASGTGFNGRFNDGRDLTMYPDFILVWLGTNDWGNINRYHLPLGDPNDAIMHPNLTTIAGSVSTLLYNLVKCWFTVPIGIMTPIQRIESNRNNQGVGYDGKVGSGLGAGGYTLEDLSNAIITIAKGYSIPVLDLYHESDLYVYEERTKNYFFSYDSQAAHADGLHPNEKAHELLSYKIQGFIRNKLMQNSAVHPPLVYNYDKTTDTYTQPMLTLSLFGGPGSSFGFNPTEYFKTYFDSTKYTITKIVIHGHDLGTPDLVAANSPFWLNGTTVTDAHRQMVEDCRKDCTELQYVRKNWWTITNIVNGYYNTDGTISSATSNDRALTTVIPVIPNNTIRLKTNAMAGGTVTTANVVYLDSSGNVVSGTQSVASVTANADIGTVATTWKVPSTSTIAGMKVSLSNATTGIITVEKVDGNTDPGDAGTYLNEWVDVSYKVLGNNKP
jgi:lysophospholipase L1-like esterase